MVKIISSSTFSLSYLSACAREQPKVRKKGLTFGGEGEVTQSVGWASVSILCMCVCVCVSVCPELELVTL